MRSHLFALTKHQVWCYLGRSELGLKLIRLYGNMSGRDFHIVEPDSDIVVEGYPRSANTYAVAALRLTNGNSLRMAHHVHGPGQITLGVYYGVPTIVLLRTPVDAVASLVQRYPFLPARIALKNYISFYKPLIQVADKVVIAEFREVINDMESVLKRVNRKYDAGLAVPDIGELQIQIKELVNEMDRRDRNSKSVNSNTVALPNAARKESGDNIKQHIHTVAEDLVLQANDIYSKLLDTIPKSATTTTVSS